MNRVQTLIDRELTQVIEL